VEGDVPVDNETFLVTDFINLKIKSAQFFRCAHKNRMCVHIFIIYLFVCVSKKIWP
jgi:hypothetical protein